MRKFSPVKEPIVAASIDQWTQRARDEKTAYRDMYTSVTGQLNTYSDMSAHGGSILEDLRTWETMLQNKTINSNTMDIIRTSLQFQHSLNVAFGRLSTALNGTVCTKLDYYSKEFKEGKEPKIKDEKEVLRLMQESEDKLLGVFENYWKCYVEFFRQGYQLGLNVKNFFVKLHPEDPVFIEVPKAFGKDLAKIWEDESDLRVVMYILKYFEEYGSLDETVLKNNIPPEAVKSIISALEKGTIPLVGNTEAMAHVLMHWINSLTDPIFPLSLQKDFLDTANMVNMQAKKEKMGGLISRLPKPNRVVLLAIIRGCVKIAREKSVGNLRYTQILLEKIADLAAALGPSLTRCATEHVPLSLALIRYLVLNSELFFPLGCEEERIFVTETIKLGRVARLTSELAPPPSLITPISLSPNLTSNNNNNNNNELSSSPKVMKIGERNSSKAGSSFYPSSYSPSVTPTLIPPSHSSHSNLNLDSSTSSSSSSSSSTITTDDDGAYSMHNYNNNSPTGSFNSSFPRALSNIGIGIGVRAPLSSSLASSFSSPIPAPAPTILTRAASSSSFIPPSPSLPSSSSSGSSSFSSFPSIASIESSTSSSSSSSQQTPPTTPRRHTIDETQPIVTFDNDGPKIFYGLGLGPTGLGPGGSGESVEKLARDVIGRITLIRTKAAESDVFDEAFAQVLKLKIVVPEVENVKNLLQMGTEFDKSELAKSRGDKLARVRTTVVIFSREIANVMETVITIFNNSEIPPETRTAINASLVRILSQLG